MTGDVILVLAAFSLWCVAFAIVDALDKLAGRRWFDDD